MNRINPPSASMSSAGGFTLIELMIVVAIISILVAIAIPQYNDYVLRGKLTSAFSALSSAQLRMEQYYQDNRAYGTAGTACGILPATLGSVQNFTLTCVTKKVDDSACDTAFQCYTYTATSTGVSSPEFIFKVTDAGVKSTTQVPTGWTNNATCWLRGKDTC